MSDDPRVEPVARALWNKVGYNAWSAQRDAVKTRYRALARAALAAADEADDRKTESFRHAEAAVRELTQALRDAVYKTWVPEKLAAAREVLAKYEAKP